MTQTVINNSDTGLTVRNALNSMFTEIYGPLPYSAAPVTPASGSVALGVRSLAGYEMLAAVNAHGIERVVMPHLARTRYSHITAIQGTNAFAIYGVHHLGTRMTTSTQAASGGVTPTRTNYFTNTPRMSLLTAAPINSLAYIHTNNAIGLVWSMGASGLGGFHFIAQFGSADTVSGARRFIGLTANTITPTNVNPATLTNTIGFAQVDGSNNWSVVFGGSSAQTPIDLGANFPVNTASTDWYEGVLFSDANDNTQVKYLVNRYTSSGVPVNTTSGTITNITPGTTLPATTTYLAETAWVTNNATATAASLHISNIFTMADS